jgi:DNA-binding NarL/FixJ family response regulator
LDKPSIQALVVEDFAPFRQLVRAIFQAQAGLQVVCEVSDGLEAVQKARELQPDLVLMDIGLPSLNGIEAARRIRVTSPQSRLLFVSMERSLDVVREALQLGASGYVLKSEARADLLNAVNAALTGETFVSPRLKDQSGTNDFLVSERTDPEESFVNNACMPHRHEAGFYSDDQHLLDHATVFIGRALRAGNAAIVVATEPHRQALLPRLQAYGVDLRAAVADGRYLALDPAETLKEVVVFGALDSSRFLELMGEVITLSAEAATSESRRVVIFGETAQLLCAQGNPEAAIQLEKLGNRLSEAYDIEILCGYSLIGATTQIGGSVFQRICSEHALVYSR